MSDLLSLLSKKEYDFGTLIFSQDWLLTELFNYYADQVDNGIHIGLIAELLTRYTKVSKKLDEANLKLKLYTDRLEELVDEKVLELTTSQIAIIHALVKLSESRDDDTGAHIERTSGYCNFIAEKIQEAGIYSDDAEDLFAVNIAKASPLHDIGKVGIEDAILLKPARLTKEEFDIMKTHVVNGHRTLASVERIYPGNKFIKLGMDISLYHHEKWDGSGYMLGLSGESIPLSARIMALSDVYDALRSKRVYKEAFSHGKAVDIIGHGRGTHFDPLLTDVFLENHEMFDQIFYLMNNSSKSRVDEQREDREAYAS